MNALKAVTLDSLAGGAVVELFDAEQKRVLENIADINTDPAQKRTITITIEYKPQGVKRDNADVKVKCTSKLAGILTVNTKLFMGLSGGKLVAVENDPRQDGLFDDQNPKPQLAPVSEFNKKVN